MLYLALALALMLVPYPAPLWRIAVVGCVVLAVVFTIVGVEVVAIFLGGGLLMGSAFLALAFGFLIRASLTWHGVRTRQLAVTGNR
jgi:hypothetical protein